MGQEQSRKLHTRKATLSDSRVLRTRKPEVTKTVFVSLRERWLEVKIPDEQMTCGWLFSEVIRACDSPDAVLALKTMSNLEILDYWLTQYERQLLPLKDNERLSIVLRRETPATLCKEQFEPIKVIGKGGFSRVLLVRRLDSGQLYAMKVMKKQFIVKAKKTAQIATERQIMGVVKHPFIVELCWAFQSDEELCLVMEFCPGGELFFHLHNIGRFTEDQAKFYFAEVLMALEHLHSLDIIYRDLKPENILLDLDGHIRLADFGLAKDRMQEGDLTYSFCGSPEYMSPEMLERKGHGRTMDYYSLGAFLYEMVTGLPPFYSSNRSKMYKQIASQPLHLPPFLSNAAKSLLEGLLCKKASERLGARFGMEEIKAHPWCAKIKWDKLLNRKILPPFRPNLTHSNFDPQYTEMSLEDSPKEPSSMHLANYLYDRSDTERSFKVTESTRSSTAIKSFWPHPLKESGDFSPDTKQDMMMFSQVAERANKESRKHSRTESLNDSPSQCKTPHAIIMPHATFDSKHVSPSHLLHSPSSPDLVFAPFSISASNSPSALIGGHFEPKQLNKKRIPSSRKSRLHRSTLEPSMDHD